MGVWFDILMETVLIAVNGCSIGSTVPLGAQTASSPALGSGPIGSRRRSRGSFQGRPRLQWWYRPVCSSIVSASADLDSLRARVSVGGTSAWNRWHPRMAPVAPPMASVASSSA